MSCNCLYYRLKTHLKIEEKNPKNPVSLFEKRKFICQFFHPPELKLLLLLGFGFASNVFVVVELWK